MKLSRRKLLAGAATAALYGASPKKADAQFSMVQVATVPQQPQVQSPSFQASAPSGAGFVRNLAIHADGTMLVSGDTFPLYLSNTSNSNGKWLNIFTPGGVSPAGSIGWTNGISATGVFNSLGVNSQSFGMWALAIAASNSSVFFVFYSGQVFCSQDKGSTWTQVGTISPSTWPAEETNDAGGCQYDHKLEVDPNNSNCVIAGTPQNGFYVSTNALSGASATWTQPTGTPTSSTAVTGTGSVGIAGIVFDKSSGTTGGLTNTVYVAVMGSGVWRTTTTVNGTWSLISGSPVAVSGAVVTGGQYYCCCNLSSVAAPNAIMTYNGSSWTSVLSVAGLSLDVNPNDATNLIYSSNDGSHNGCIFQVSTSGTNSLQYTTVASAAGDCPALQLMQTTFYSTGQVRFDPTTAHKMWMCCGVGVFNTTSITSATMSAATTVTYTPQTKGIGGQVGNVIKSIPGTAGFMLGIYDRNVWRVTDPTVEPSTFGVASLQKSIKPCWDLDWASDLSGTCIAIVGSSQTTGDSNGAQSMFSTNNGASWALMNSVGTPPWTGSQPQHCAASTSSNWCVMDGSATSPIYYTTNAGVAWNTATGNPSINTSGGQNKCQILCADRVTANTFYVAATGNGLYSSSNSGATWTKAGNLPTTLSNYFTLMQTAPGNAGHIWLANVTSSMAAPSTHPQSGQLLYSSTNGGVSWTTVANVEDILGFGFGAVAPGFTYPTIWIVGWVKVGANPYKYGVWVSKDQASTWTWLIDYPAGSYDYLFRICGDMLTYNQCYILAGSSSAIYGKNLSF